MIRFGRVLALLALAAAGAHPAWAGTTSELQRYGALFQLKCAKCHTIGRGDRVGPDLRGVATRHERDWLLGFIQHPDAYLDTDPAAKALKERYNGVRMEETHLSPAEVEGVLAYVEAAAAAPPSSEGPSFPEEPLAGKVKMPDEGVSVSVPGIALTLLLLAAGAALWQAGGHAPALAFPALAVALGYWSLGGRHYLHLLGNEQGYEPEQPIAFSHAKHAGTLHISCLYCHGNAERSDVAGVPPVAVCMNCHVAVKKTAGAKDASPEIAKLLAAWDTRASTAPATVAWTRVHRLPDFVHFNHRVHVANDIQCQECHGPVQTMSRMRQAASLSMGWCVGCHRLQAGAAPAHWKRSGGPLDCAACHW